MNVIYDPIIARLRQKDPITGADLSGVTTADIAESTDKKYITNAEETAIGTIGNKLDKNTPIFGATKTKITYDADGLVTAGADATTADIADSSNKRYVTDANLVSIAEFNGSFTSSNSTNFAWTDNTLAITHGLNKQFVTVDLYDNNNNKLDYTITGTSTSVVAISFPIGAIPITGTYNVRIK